MVKQGDKGIVVAWNTATIAAIGYLRKKYDIPVIGMEPAFKPAIEQTLSGDIAVLATPMTLRLDKINDLIVRVNGTGRVLKIPAPRLVDYVENGQVDSEEIKAYLKSLFEPYDTAHFGAIVLGCTHFLYLKQPIIEVIGRNIAIFDGNPGPVNQGKNVLHATRGLNLPESMGEILITNSLSDAMVDQSWRMFEIYQEMVLRSREGRE